MRKLLKMDNNGDAVMVTAVLLMSLFLSAGSQLLISYGEDLGKDNDREHMTDVEESMLRLRTSMKSLLKAEDTDTLMVNRFTLGTMGNPYLAVARSSGTLTHTNDPSDFHMEVVIEDGGSEDVLNTVSGALIFESNNYYYHDQDLTIISGGVIKEQHGFETMSSYPDLSISHTISGYSLDMFLFGMAGDYWKVSGIESLILSVSMIGYSQIDRIMGPGEVLSVRINGMGERSWYEMMEGTFQTFGLISGVDYQINVPVDWDDAGQELEVEFLTLESLSARICEMEVTL